MPSEEERNLDLLATFHYVVGGIGVFFALFPLIHLFIGIAIITGSIPTGSAESGNHPPPDVFGYMFAIIGGAFFLIGQACAWLTIYSGRLLKTRRKRKFSFVFACIQCAFFPFGTVLGVFTIIVLNKEKAKNLFSD